jgi:hypothetical protein
MATPVMTLRVPHSQRATVKAVAQALKRDPSIAERIKRTLIGKGIDGATTGSVGPFKDEASAIAFLSARLVATLAPREIWLFGSRARGDAEPDSDFDLLVVLPDGRPEEDYSYRSVAHPLIASGLRVNVLPCRWSEFAAAGTETSSIPGRALNEGRRVYRDSSSYPTDAPRDATTRPTEIPFPLSPE